MNDKVKFVRKDMIPLTDISYEKIDWKGAFQYPNMIRIYTDMTDNSCFFSAIANSFFIPYRKGKINNIPITQGEIVRRLRMDLAIRLGSINPQTGRTYWEELGSGTIRSLSTTIPEYRLNFMQQELMSKIPVGNKFNEFVSNQLNKDIYILSAEQQDFYNTGDDYNKLFKNRDSIVLLYLPGHYELIGINNHETGTQTTLFPSNHPFIKAIRKRIYSLSQ